MGDIGFGEVEGIHEGDRYVASGTARVELLEYILHILTQGVSKLEPDMSNRK